MMGSLAINGTPLLGAAFDFWLIARLAGSALSNRQFWAGTSVLATARGTSLLMFSEPFDLFKDFYRAHPTRASLVGTADAAA